MIGTVYPGLNNITFNFPVTPVTVRTPFRCRRIVYQYKIECIGERDHMYIGIPDDLGNLSVIRQSPSQILFD